MNLFNQIECIDFYGNVITNDVQSDIGVNAFAVCDIKIDAKSSIETIDI